MFWQWVPGRRTGVSKCPTTVCDLSMWLYCRLMAGSWTKMLSMYVYAGWRREVVYRSVSANVRAKSPPSEICYFSPDGTKVVFAIADLLHLCCKWVSVFLWCRISEVTERHVHASEKGVPLPVVGTVRRWCRDYAAGLEESSTGEVPQKFCCITALAGTWLWTVTVNIVITISVSVLDVCFELHSTVVYLPGWNRVCRLLHSIWMAQMAVI